MVLPDTFDNLVTVINDDLLHLVCVAVCIDGNIGRLYATDWPASSLYFGSFLRLLY